RDDVVDDRPRRPPRRSEREAERRTYDDEPYLVDDTQDEGRHPIAYLGLAGLGGMAALAGAVTLTFGGLTAFSALAYAATPYPAYAAQSLGAAAVFGGLTVGGAATVAVLLGGAAAVFVLSAPEE